MPCINAMIQGIRGELWVLHFKYFFPVTQGMISSMKLDKAHF